MKEIKVAYTMKKPERVETVETEITLPVSDVVAQLVCGAGQQRDMVRNALEPIANLQGYVLDKIETVEVV